MRNPVVRSMVASALLLGACTTTQATPATAPETSQPATTTTAVSPTTTTTTTSAPSTTVDRKTEIEAIFQDLEQRRLTALYEGDREAFAALFANDAYLERSLGAFEVVDFTERPSATHVAVVSVLSDETDCIAAVVAMDPVPELVGSESTVHNTVLERTTSTAWGLSYAGEGWECSGTHPLSR